MDIIPERGAAEFDWFRMDFKERRLFQLDDARNPDLVVLGSRAFDILALLISRHGDLVSKSEIIDTVWPDVIVEDSNLTVQISTLRRVLDEGRKGSSCIQTVSKRGYRFLPEVRWKAAGVPAMGEEGRRSTVDERPPAPAVPRARYKRPVLIATLLGVFLIAIVLFEVADRFHAHSAPRLSVAVMPFATDPSNPDLIRFGDRLAEGLATDLSQLWDVSVSDYQATRGYKDQPPNSKAIGRTLGVRYLVVSDLSAAADRIALHAAMVSGETGAALWSDQIILPSTDITAAEETARTWLHDSIGIETTKLEAERSQRKPPEQQDALDLILQARALTRQPAAPDRWRSAQALYEQALKEDHKSYLAMTGLVEGIIANATLFSGGINESDIRKVERLITFAEGLAPTDPHVLFTRAYLFRVELRWPEALAAYEHLLAFYPQAHGATFMRGICLLNLGRAEDALPLFQKLVLPHAAYGDDSPRYFRLGQAYLFAGRYEEAIPWFRKTVVAAPERPPSDRYGSYAMAASALALAGHLDAAREELAKAEALYPYFSASTFWDTSGSNEPRYVAQLSRMRQGLALAGLRLHIDEDVPGLATPPTDLQTDIAGLTPREVPGARLIRTKELVELLRDRPAVLLDGEVGTQSIPGAISLPWISVGGTVSDDMQPEFGRLLAQLTHGDMTRPIVTVGVNAYHWPGYNLARRAAALGYLNVFWYRGGRDSWMAAGQAMAPMQPDPLAEP